MNSINNNAIITGQRSEFNSMAFDILNSVKHFYLLLYKTSIAGAIFSKKKNIFPHSSLFPEIFTTGSMYVKVTPELCNMRT